WTLSLTIMPAATATLSPYTTLFRSGGAVPRRPPGRDPDTSAGACAVHRAGSARGQRPEPAAGADRGAQTVDRRRRTADPGPARRPEEHTSELQSREKLVCGLLLEKK